MSEEIKSLKDDAKVKEEEIISLKGRVDEIFSEFNYLSNFD